MLYFHSCKTDSQVCNSENCALYFAINDTVLNRELVNWNMKWANYNNEVYDVRYHCRRDSARVQKLTDWFFTRYNHRRRQVVCSVSLVVAPGYLTVRYSRFYNGVFCFTVSARQRLCTVRIVLQPDTFFYLLQALSLVHAKHKL